MKFTLLDGKKTYIVAVAIVLSAAGAFFQGDITLGDAVSQVLQGLGFAALRFGVASTSTAKE